MAYIKFDKVGKIYKGSVEVKAVENCSFEIEKGEFVVILGPSGAGKTTILNMLGGMDSATSGDIYVDGKNIAKLKNHDLLLYRRYDIGFVFQFYNLIMNLTTLENVELACQLSKKAFNPKEILTSVGLENRLNNFPSQLSGGEQQRVAIARAIAKNPKILELLKTTCKNFHITTIVITHNSLVAEVADKVITVKNGTVTSVKINENPKDPKEIVW